MKLIKLGVAVVMSVLSLGACTEPETAFGPLLTEYTTRGFTVPLGNLSVYIAFPNRGDGTKAVVWGHDIFGPTSGRTYELVDQLAEDTEYTVLLPDFFRGEESPPPETYEWDTVIKYDWEDTLKPFLASLGVTSVGTVGTCWGSYWVVHASADPLVKAGFATHPAHPGTMADFGEDEEAQYELINDVEGSQYYFPTPGDSDTLRPGNLADNTLDDLQIYETEEPCTHGYFNRGDLSDPLVAECVDYTYEEMLIFFEERL